MLNYLDKICQAAGDVLKKHFAFIITFWALNALPEAAKFAYSRGGEEMLGYSFSIFLITLIIAVIIDKIPDKVAKYIKCLLCIAVLPAFILEAFIVYQYDALVGVGVVASIIETNPEESAEFFNMYVTDALIWYSADIVIFVALMAYFRPWRYTSIAPDDRKRLTGILLVPTVGYTIFMLSYFPGMMLEDPLVPTTRVITSVSKAIENIKAYENLVDQLQTDVELTRNDSSITNVVFILGESTNRNHMHLYGYYLPNTPNLDDMAATGEISVFRDVVSPHSTTIEVLRKLFTFCDKESDKEWYEYNNLIDVMNSAGYTTYWLSNQESSGEWGNVAKLYAKRSKENHFTEMRDSHEDNGRVDGELFPMIDETIAKTAGKKSFYVIHLMGGHVAYYNRYPYIFTKFKPNDITLPETTDGQKKIISQYDNALFYNDWVVSGIIDKFRVTDTDALVFYLPDHGEAVYDEGGVAGHIEENPSRHMVEVPFIIWGSDKFKALHPDKWKKIQAAVNKPYMSDDMIHTVLDLVDIETIDYDPTKSIVNDSFNMDRARFFDNWNYDEEVKTGKADSELVQR